MTGANEAELMNELRTPFAMFGLIDNMANGLGEKLTVRRLACCWLLCLASCALTSLDCRLIHACVAFFCMQLEDFKLTQKLNADRMEKAICLVLDRLAETQFLSVFAALPAQA